MVDQRKTVPLEKRKLESARIMENYPDRVPVYVLRSSKSSLPNIDKYKYLVPKDLTVYHLAFIIRKRLNLNSNEAIFLYCEDRIIKGDNLVCALHERAKEPDGFLYITYCEETVLGSGV